MNKQQYIETWEDTQLRLLTDPHFKLQYDLHRAKKSISYPINKFLLSLQKINSIRIPKPGEYV